MKTLKQKFGARLQKIRKSKGMTQEMLAEKLNWDAPNISNIERGKYFVTAETLNNIAQALNVEIRELFDFEYMKHRDVMENAIKSYVEKCDDAKLEFLTKVISNLEEFRPNKRI